MSHHDLSKCKGDRMRRNVLEPLALDQLSIDSAEQISVSVSNGCLYVAVEGFNVFRVQSKMGCGVSVHLESTKAQR